jgi:transposase
VLEPTGVYHLELARRLHALASFELMVVNPTVLRNFGRALRQRSKTDPDDASTALEYARRMEYVPWQPPSDACFRLRAISRRIDTLLKLELEERNRRHALERQGEGVVDLLETVDAHLAFLREQVRGLEAGAKQVIDADPVLAERFCLLGSVPGFALRSGIRLLAELCVLPEEMSRRQWVAHGGLDPCRYESGTSVHRRTRISRRGNGRLRSALYMPALVAVKTDAHVRAFYDELVAAGKAKRQALTAVMRKLLHAIWGVFHAHQPFDGSRFRTISA